MKFAIGQRVMWRRAVSTWGRVGIEFARGEVIQVTPARVRIRLTSGIRHGLTALVRPDRLQLEK